MPPAWTPLVLAGLRGAIRAFGEPGQSTPAVPAYPVGQKKPNA